MPRTLKIILKVIAAFVVVIVLLFFGSLWYITHNKSKVLKLVNDELNSRLDGTVIIGDMKPNFFQNFPDISLGLKNVLIRDKRFNEHHRTLLDAKDFSVSVKAWPLFKGSIKINHIDISNAAVDLFTDSTGYSNRSVFKTGPKKKKDTTTNNYDSRLGRFSLTNVNFKVEDQSKRKRFDFIANSLNGSMSNPDTGWNAAFHMDITAKSMAFNTKNGSFIKNKILEGDLTAGYNENTGRLWVHSPSLDIADDPFVISAVFQTLTKPSSFTIHLEAKQAMWRRVSALLSANIQKKLDQFNITKPIAVRGVISGSFSGGQPSIYVTATVKDNTVITPGGTIENCSFGGIFSNEYEKGKGFSDDNSVIRLVDLKGSYRKMPFWISQGSIVNLNKPVAVGDFHADFPLAYANEIMGRGVAKFTRGRVIMHLRYQGDIVNYQLNRPTVAGSIVLRNADFKYLPENISFQNSAISLLIKDNDLFLRNIRLQSGKSIVSMEGKVNNFMNLYYSAPEKILVNCD
ncbi:MAG TPA: AsmA family protein, partial [Mucilaginibacter sp.]|nr:AsmA family protein [Mucilaginibacter sp.]